VTREIWRQTQVSGYGHGSEGRDKPWAGLRQVVLVRTTRERIAGPESLPVVEDHHYLTSFLAENVLGSAESLLLLIREHWGIENGLHHVKDRTMREDDQRAGLGATLMARLRGLVVGLQRFVSGAWTSMREDTVQNNLAKAVNLLTRKRFPRKALLLL
jgi:hypothetical protein